MRFTSFRMCLLLVAGFGVATLGACRGSSNSDSLDAGTSSADAGNTPPAAVEVCDRQLPAPSEGTCDVVQGTGSAVVIYGDVLGEDTIYENGTVVYDGDVISCVGCNCDSAPGFADATVLTCAGAAISPGLINPHDHITFTEGAPINTGAKRYNHRHDWRGELRTPRNPHGTDGNSDGTRWGELRMLMSGVTAMVGSGKADRMVRNLDRLDADDRALGFKKVDFQTFSLGDSNERFRDNCGWNYKETEVKVSEQAAFLPHVAEGINDYAVAEFKCQSTSFGNAQDFVESNATFIHAIGLTAADYFNMARDGARVLWSPRSNISLYGMTADVATFARLGGIIALGTDWTYSGSVNMSRELACADQYNSNQLDHYFSDKQLFEMATKNAAIATASDTLIGSLAVGKLADIVIYGGSNHFYRAVISTTNKDVALVVQAGNALYGDAALMTGVGKSCDPLDVCGSAKTVCANEQFGKAFAGIQGAVSGAYPAFFCGDPAGEPTCIPSRPGEFTGIATDSDSDGDGIANADDNCPKVFNPIRPIDGGVQPDSDGDGQGDPCDETPLKADLDGDGKDNLADNCPFDSNADQADTDSDSKGNVCDFCPDTSNPDSVCPDVIVPAMTGTIADVQDGTLAADVRVKISDSIVTAVYARGFWMQDPANSGTFSGVHVFTGTAPSVVVGDKVDVDGRTTEFFGETELTSATITNKGAGTPITAVTVTVAEAATEPYEGMLVALSDVNIATIVDPYDCSGDSGGSCADANLWQVNSAIVVYDRVYSDTDWVAQKGQAGITGIMSFRHNTRRIQPRTAADLTTP